MPDRQDSTTCVSGPPPKLLPTTNCLPTMSRRLTLSQRLGGLQDWELGPPDCMGPLQEAPEAPAMKLSAHARWLLHRRRTDVVVKPTRAMLPKQHQRDHSKAWVTNSPISAPGATPFVTLFSFACSLPLHLYWLGVALDHGCVGAGPCPHCQRPLNPGLSPVGVGAWRGYERELVPECNSIPVSAPPGGWHAQFGPWPAHGLACISSYHAPEIPPTPPTEWDVAYQKLSALRRSGKISTVFAWGNGIHPRLRTELLEDSTLTLT